MKEIIIEREVRIGKDSTRPVPMSAATRRVDESSVEVPRSFLGVGIGAGVVMLLAILALVFAS